MSETSMNGQRLEQLESVIKADVAAGLYHGMVLRVARGGRVVFDKAIGAADQAQSKPLALNSVFSIFSVTKAFTNLLTLRAIEEGRYALTTRVSDVITDFKGKGREQVTFFHLLSHQSGFPIIFELRPQMYIDQFDDMIAAVLELVYPEHAPGERLAYSPMVNHILMAEALRRTDPKRRSYRQMVQEDLLDPLKMADTSVGLRADLKPRKVVPDFRGNYPIGHKGRSNYGPNGAFEEEHAEMPWVGIASTVPDMFRFAEACRLGGSLDGARIISPATLKLACQVHTGDKPNDLYTARGKEFGIPPVPGYIGLGFSMRGPALIHHMFGTLASPGTFGNYGAGTTLWWVDPERDLTFVCLSAGLMEHNANTARFQKLSDMVISACD
jgi:CubicO group peptidase (beta-lactamase class C family)